MLVLCNAKVICQILGEMSVLKKEDRGLNIHQYCRNGRGKDLFPPFPHKINYIYGYHGDRIRQILAKIVLLMTEVVDLHIHTKCARL